MPSFVMAAVLIWRLKSTQHRKGLHPQKLLSANQRRGKQLPQIWKAMLINVSGRAQRKGPHNPRLRRRRRQMLGRGMSACQQRQIHRQAVKQRLSPRRTLSHR